MLSHINSYEHLAKSAIFPGCDERAVHGINLIRLRPNTECIIPEYLSYCLKSEYFINTAKIYAQRAVNQASIKLSDIKKIKIPLTPLTVQQEIVDEIESYQRIIDGARQVVDNYKPTIKVEEGWEQFSVGDLYDINYGLTISIPQNIDDNGIKIISTAEVGLDGNLDLSNVRKVKYQDSYNRFILEPDTLLFNWRNAPKHVGKTAYFNEKEDKYISASFLLSLKCKKPDICNNLFVWCVLNNLRESGYFMRNSRQAVNQTNFNGEQLSKTQIFLPPLEKQDIIVAGIQEEMSIVEQNKRLIEIFQQKIADKIAEVWGE